MEKKKRNLILGLVLVLLLLVVGVTYAFFTYENGTRSEIVTGQIYLNYTEENKITLTNAWPETKASAMQRTDNVFEFIIEGQNTSREDIYYAIKINYADDIAGKNRILAEHIKIYLECDGEVLVDGLTYQDWNDKKIEIATIPAGTTNMITKNYSLRMWIDENVTISDTSSSADYTTSEWNNTYANMIINVIGNFDYQDTDYITYDANGGDYTPVKTSVNTGKVTLQKPVMENKAFLGWSSNPDATEIEYYSGDVYTGDGQILYAVYGDTRNVMTDLSAVGDSGLTINEVYFINDTQENIDTRYEVATNKWDLTLDNQGSVKGWIETDTEGNNILYIGSEGTTYLSTGAGLFDGYNYWDTWGYTNNIELTNVDTSMVTDMSGMFSYCYGLTSLNLTAFNTSDVSNMGGMFYMYGSSLVSIDLSSFDTSNVTNMGSMFGGLEILTTLDVSNFDTSKVTDMQYMFYKCNSLPSLDLSNFDTSKVTDMTLMFYYCESLISLDVSEFDTSVVTSMYGMFQNCSILASLDVSSFYTPKVTSMDDMFRGCSDLTSLDLSNFDTSEVTTADAMFRGCSSLTTIYANIDWNTGNVISSTRMFQNCTSLVGAVPFDSTKVDITMANPDTGYFTKKEA